jgi:uncharacterized protein (DUF58 family)
MAETADIFDAAFLRQLQALDGALLRLRGQAGEGLARHGRAAGQHEFRGHRPYAPGDDLRRLDWNAYGRLGRFFLREFERERLEHLTLVADTSASMAVAGKHVLARRACAAAGYLTLRGGGSVTHQGITVEGQARFARLLDSLRVAGPEGGPLAGQLADLASRPRPPADLLVATDGLEEPAALAPLAALAQRRCNVTLLCVLAPDELNPAAAGAATLRALEGGELALNLDDATLAAYGAELQRHLDGLRALGERHGWIVVITPSDTSLRDLFLRDLAGASA